MKTMTRVLLGVVLCSFAGLSVQCTSQEAGTKPAETAAKPAGAGALAAWDVIYGVLQHPRCMNCHPAGNVPLQGDESRPHGQYVTRGADGQGAAGMRCDTCHQTRNLDAPHLPPGAPNWHLPKPEMPLVFQGRSKGELCRQLADPKHNGGKTPEQILEHMERDALVLWGWAPGPGRAPVATPHEDLVAALRTWVEGGCECPER